MHSSSLREVCEGGEAAWAEENPPATPHAAEQWLPLPSRWSQFNALIPSEAASPVTWLPTCAVGGLSVKQWHRGCRLGQEVAKEIRWIQSGFRNCGLHHLEFIVALAPLAGPLRRSGSHKVSSLLLLQLDNHATEETSSLVRQRCSTPSGHC